MAGLLPDGVWGGLGGMLIASDPKAGATIEFDCAHGRIRGPVTVDANGVFKWKGSYTAEGGPDPAGGRPSMAAVYSGQVFGDTLELSVSLASGVTGSPVRLQRGIMGQLRKCK
jgi:hypothetical protein